MCVCVTILYVCMCLAGGGVGGRLLVLYYRNQQESSYVQTVNMHTHMHAHMCTYTHTHTHTHTCVHACMHLYYILCHCRSQFSFKAILFFMQDYEYDGIQYHEPCQTNEC